MAKQDNKTFTKAGTDTRMTYITTAFNGMNALWNIFSGRPKRLIQLIFAAMLFTSVGTINADTLTEIQKRGKVRVGTLYTFPNWGFYDDKRQPAGFEIEMARELGKAMGVEIEFVETTTPNRIPFLDTKKIDLAMNVFSVTPERALRVAFSRPYAALTAVMFSKKDDGIANPAALAGKRIAVSKGTGSAARIRAAAPASASFLEYDTPADTFLAVLQGKADAGAEGFDGVAAFIKRNPQFAIKGEPLAPHFMVAVGMRPDDYSLIRWVDTWLLTMENEGKTEQIYQKWFGVKRSNLPK